MSVVDKAIRQLTATGAFLREIPVLDTNKKNFLNQRIQTALVEIRKTIDAQRAYDEKQLDETTKFNTKPRPDAESVAKMHAEFIVKEILALLDKKQVEVYEYRVINTIDSQLSKDNIELKELLKEKTIELELAQKEITRLETELARITAEKEHLERELANEKRKYSGLEEAKRQVEEQIKIVTAELKKQNLQALGALEVEKEKLSKIQELQELNVDLQKQIVLLQQGNISLTDANKKAIETISELKSQVNARDIEISTLKQQLVDLQAQLDKVHKDLLNARATRARNEYSIYEKEKSKLEKTIDNLQSEQRNAELNYKRRLAEIQDQKTSVVNADTQTVNVEKVTELQSKITALELQIGEETKKKVEALKENKTYESKITELTTDAESLKSQLSTALANAAQQIAQVAATQSMNAQTDGKTAEGAEVLENEYRGKQVPLQENIAALRNQLSQINQTPASSTTDFDSIQKILSELQESGANNLAFEEALTELDKLVLTDATAKTIRERLVVIFTEYSKTLQELSEKQAKAVETPPLQEIPEVSDAAQNHIDVLTKQLEETQATALEYQDKFLAVTQKNKGLQNEITQITEKFTQDLSSMTAERDRYKNIFENMQTILKQLGDAMGVENSDSSEFIRIISEKLQGYLGIIQKAQIYEVLTTAFQNASETIRTATTTMGKINQANRIDYAERLAQISNALQTQIGQIQSRIQENRQAIQLADQSLDDKKKLELKLQDVTKALSDASDRIGEVIQNAQTNSNTSILELNTSLQSIVSGLETRIIQTQPGANEIINRIRALERTLEEKLRITLDERNAAMETITNSVKSVIQLVKDYGIKLPNLEQELKQEYEPISNEVPAGEQTVYTNEYDKLIAQWKNLAAVLPSALNRIGQNLQSEMTQVRQTQGVLTEVLSQLSGYSGIEISETSTPFNVSTAAQKILAQLDETKANKDSAKKLEEKLADYDRMSQQVQSTKDALAALQEELAKEKEKNIQLMNDSNGEDLPGLIHLPTSQTAELGGFPTNRTTGQTQLKTGQRGIRQNSEDTGGQGGLPILVNGGCQQPISGGSELLAPIIAVGGLLWWGFGALLIFLILIVIYLLGSEIYKTQFKSENRCEVYV